MVRLNIVLGGLGLFLFGIMYLGNGLKSLAGERMRSLIDRYTSTYWKALIVGMVVTILIQSSSATTILTIGLISAGLMNLKQAVGIIMGSNIGTTMTAFLIGFNIEQYSLYFVAAGAFLLMFSKQQKRQYIGQTLLGFGVLFFGLGLMGDEMKLLADSEGFINFAKQMEVNPILGLLIGTVFSAIIQSSSASIAIAQKLYSAGAVTLGASLPFIFGSNIGSIIDTIASSFGGTISAKRAAMVHFIFKAFGTIVFMVLLYPIQNIILSLTSQYNLNPEMQIAIAHISFNLGTTIVLFPFSDQLIKLVKRLLPGKDDEVIDFAELDNQVIHVMPGQAIAIAEDNTVKLGAVVLEQVNVTTKYIKTNSQKYADEVARLETVVDNYTDKISSYLIRIVSNQLNEDLAIEYMAIMSSIRDLERIGDHCTNIVGFINMINSANEEMSEEAKEDLLRMMDIVIKMIEACNIAFAKRIVDNEVAKLEDEIDALNEKARKRHIKRVSKGIETAATVIAIYVDILSGIERMGDHANIIAHVYGADASDIL